MAERRTPWVVCGDDWGRHVSTIQHLFRAMPPEELVVWVNSYGHRAPRFSLYDARRVAQKIARRFEQRPPPPPIEQLSAAPARIVEPRALPWHHSGLAQAFNVRALAHDIRRALDRVAPGMAPWYLTATPVTPGLIGRLGERASIYFCMDDYAELPDVEGAMVRPLERALLGRVDGMVATARALVEKKMPASGKAFYLPQGVNYDHFAAPRPVPPDLARLPRPLIGFAGGVSAACDLDIMLALSDRFPAATVVLVGPLAIDVTPLQRPNIAILGNRPYADLPAYVQAFDVGIIPYILNDWTRAVDPLKLLEYLAAGIPVVTTDLPEVRKYSEAIRIGATREAFVAAVAETLAAPAGSTRQRGQAVAQANTWQRRAERLREIVIELGEKGSSAPRSQ